MKILLFNHFPLQGSGSGTYTAEVARTLAKEGHEVAVIYPEHKGALLGLCEINSEKALYLDEQGIWHAPIYFQNDLEDNCEKIELTFNFPCFTSHPRSHNTYYDLSVEELEHCREVFSKRLGEVIELFKPEILHIQHVWLGAYAARMTGLPYVVTCHGTDLMGYANDVRYRFYADEAARGAAFIIGVSDRVSEKVRETYPVEATKILTMISGYNEDRFNLCSHEPIKLVRQIKAENKQANIVSFAGKMTHFKGVDILLKAAQVYEESEPNVHTILAGSGVLYGALVEEAKRLKLKRTHFVGNLEQEALSSLYQSATLHVVPSREEPFGLVAVEALACGTPVVGTNAGGLSQIIHSSVGELIPLEDYESLAAAVCHWTKKNGDRSHDSVCHEHAKRHFSWLRVARELTTCYEDAIRSRPSV